MLRWGGAACLIVSIFAFVVSRYFAVRFAPTMGESIEIRHGEVWIAWRTSLVTPLAPTPLFDCGALTELGLEWTFSLTKFYSLYILVFPLWVTMVVGSAAAIIGSRMRRAVATGLCPKCGYDRKGLSEGAACPECGRRAGDGAP
jgi:hypothetical protein